MKFIFNLFFDKIVYKLMVKKWIIDGYDNKRISNCYFMFLLGVFNLFLYLD